MLVDELDAVDEDDLSSNYRSIVAAITLLEWRASGRAPITETISLATA